MPLRCAIRGCNSKNISSEENFCIFKFPDCEQTKNIWIAATKRTNWYPSKYSGICSFHFRKEDFVPPMLKAGTGLRLNQNAVPTIFNTVASGTVIKIEEVPAPSEPLRSPDYIVNFGNFSKQYRDKLDLTNYLVYESTEVVVFYKLQPAHNVGCNIATRICITNQMRLKVIIESSEIFSTDLRQSEYSQIASVLDKYRHETPEFAETREHLLNRALHYLKKARDSKEDFDHFGKLDIIINQVEMLQKGKLRYESETFLMGFLIRFFSVGAYNVLKKFLLFPTSDYLRQSSRQCLTFPNLSSAKYDDDLLLRNTKGTENDKYVALVIDGILVNPLSAVTKPKRGGPAKMKFPDIIMVYTMKSIFGDFKKIVRLLPVSLPTEDTLFNLTKSLIQFVQRLGFKVLVVVTTNTEINRKVFEKYCPTNNFFANPDFPELKIFYQYDSADLLKSVRDNWIRLKNRHKTFTYPDIEDFSMKSAAFAHFEILLSTCKSHLPGMVQTPYMLNAITVNPNISEQRNISLSENLFHDSTIEAMGQFSDMSETANFCGLIGRWWNIVNTKGAETIINRDNWTVDENVLFLEKFLIWLDVWGSSPDSTARLAKETLEGLQHNTKIFLHLIKFCFDHLTVDAIKLRKIRSDDYESRFNLDQL